MKLGFTTFLGALAAAPLWVAITPPAEASPDKPVIALSGAAE